jgi:GxxExxY protein
MALGATDGQDPLTREIIGGAIEVHKALGPGLLEGVYEECLALELVDRGLSIQRQVQVPIVFKGRTLDMEYRLDMLVNDTVVLELKSVEKLNPVHEAQLLTYMKLSGKRVGLLLNFHTPYLCDSIKRFVL